METRRGFAPAPSTSYCPCDSRSRSHSRNFLPPPARHHCGRGWEAAPDEFTRRQQLALLAPLLFSAPSAQAATPDALRQQQPSGPAAAAASAGPPPAVELPDYAQAGPFQPVRLPQLEHTCTSCPAPAERCRLKIQTWVPKGGSRIGKKRLPRCCLQLVRLPLTPPPMPLSDAEKFKRQPAKVSTLHTPLRSSLVAGFLVAGHQYDSYAQRLASWGYCALTYDSSQQALDPLNDLVYVSFLRDLLDWCRTSPPLSALCDTNCVMLAGHSRGAKVAALAAAEDERVKALFLIDPVDNTPWAPLGPGFPSAAAALADLAAQGRSLPVAVVGSALGADCAPAGANYERFYDAVGAPAWEIVLRDAGHLQFLDSRGGNAMDLVCAAGTAPDAAVSELTRAAMTAWAEIMVRGGGGSRAGSRQLGDSPLQCGIDRNGELVAGLASFDSLQALFATEEAFRRGGGLAVTTRLKNFKLI